ncbi:integrator complex subunit 12-like [Chironomus tepperi]|uniref:integrator complex subunit 12-like n=1 Tax=Chironomus tepperi TaxID=113505 RepID=UPI00391EF4ED
MDDSYITAAIKLLHSSAPDSAEKMRTLLNTEILKHYDKTKLVENHLSKKQVDSLISQETKAVGSGFKLKKHKTKKIEELKLPTTSLISENQQIIKTDDPAEDSSDNESSSAMDLLTDLTCVVCRQMDNSANNQLFECIECHQLWHQLCHSTKIPNDADQNSWTCSTCKKKEGSSKSIKSYESSESSSSSSYKHKEKEKEKVIEKEREKEKKEKEKDKQKEKSEKRKSDSSSKSTSKKSKESSSSSSSRSRSSKKSS